MQAMVVITLSATIRQLKPPSCSDVARQAGTCAGPSGLHRAVLYIGMALLVVATGGANPTSLPFGADQFDHDDASSGSSSNEADERRRRAEEPAGLKRFYNWYYVVTMMASFMALTFIAYIQDKVSWGLGFGIPTALVAATFAVFLAGTPLYVRVPAEGSIFSSVARVVVASCRKRRLTLPHPRDARQQEAVLYNPPVVVAAGTGTSRVFKLPLTLQLSFLNKAAIVTADADEIRPDGSPARPWSLCSVQQVEEVKCLIRIVPVWSTGIIYYVAVVQQSTYVVLSALQSDRHLGRSFQIPAASFTVFAMLAQTLWIPIYDRLLVPRLRRVTGKDEGLTLLQRQGIGIALSTVAMVMSAVVEDRRRHIALTQPTLGTTITGGAISAMSSLWMVPQLMVLGLSEAFNLISQIEFYYKEIPEHMRSVAGALAFCNLALGNYLSGFLVTIVHRTTGAGSNWLAQDLNKGRLDLFYWMIAGIGIFNIIYFMICAKWYRFKGAAAN